MDYHLPDHAPSNKIYESMMADAFAYQKRFDDGTVVEVPRGIVLALIASCRWCYGTGQLFDGGHDRIYPCEGCRTLRKTVGIKPGSRVKYPSTPQEGA